RRGAGVRAATQPCARHPPRGSRCRGRGAAPPAARGWPRDPQASPGGCARSWEAARVSSSRRRASTGGAGRADPPDGAGAALGGRPQREAARPPHQEGVEEGALCARPLGAGEVLHELLERDATLEPRERGPEAEVLAEAEAEVPAGVAGGVEAVRVREAPLVA